MFVEGVTVIPSLKSVSTDDGETDDPPEIRPQGDCTLTAADDDRLFALDCATVARPGGAPVFANLTWTVREEETWAIVGPTGAGKTSLAETLLGRLPLQNGTLTWLLLERLRATGRTIGWPSEVVRRVSFKEESWRFSYARHYYQQRFNFIEPHDDLTLTAFLRSGTGASDSELQRVARQLGIDMRLDLSLIKLSNGETRRARIARALLGHPELLLLDEPFMGVDSGGRAEIAALLQQLRAQGTRLVLITRPETIPDWITHVLALDQQRIAWQGPRSNFRPPLLPPDISPAPSAPQATTTPLIELRHVNVVYDERHILHDVSWTVCAGERWAVLGPNGSGKSTLLSLLCGDHPQAYSNDIRLFGRQRGSGESIWDIKAQIGLVSPELHLYFSEPLSAARTAATGFFDVLVARRTTREQEERIRTLFAQFEIVELLDRPFAALSTGQQRLVLLIRALVKRPALLILDEPFQGLDSAVIAQVRRWLDTHLTPEQTLLFVSHYAAEIPTSVHRSLRLENGRVVSQT